MDATPYAVLPLPVDLSCFHMSADYIFIPKDAVFFFRPWLAVLLSLKEIVVGGPSYLHDICRLRVFPAKDPFYHP